MASRPCAQYIDNISSFVDSLDLLNYCNKPKDLIDAVLEAYLKRASYAVKTAWYWIPAARKEKYIRTAKIQFWKLKRDPAFLTSCSQKDAAGLRRIVKETIKSLEDYISYCTGKAKNYTYKHLNKNVREFNAGLDPSLPEKAVEPAAREERYLRRIVSAERAPIIPLQRPASVNSLRPANNVKPANNPAPANNVKPANNLQRPASPKPAVNEFTRRVKLRKAKNLLKRVIKSRKERRNNKNDFHTAWSYNHNENRGLNNIELNSEEEMDFRPLPLNRK